MITWRQQTGMVHLSAWQGFCCEGWTHYKGVEKWRMMSDSPRNDRNKGRCIFKTCRLHLNIYVCAPNTIASIDDLVGFVYIIRCSSTGETCFIHLFIRWLGVWCLIIRKVMSSNLFPYTIWRWIRHLLSALSNPSAENQNIMELNWTLYLFNLFLTSYTYIILIWSFNSCVGV